MDWFVMYAIGCAMTLFLAYTVGLGAGRKRPLFGYGFGIVLLGLSLWLGRRAWQVAGHIWPGIF